MNRIIYKGFAVAFVALTLTACAGRKTYERPNVVNEKLFRTDNIPTDSLSSANVSWRNIFTDATLQGHINKALLSLPLLLRRIIPALRPLSMRWGA